MRTQIQILKHLIAFEMDLRIAASALTRSKRVRRYLQTPLAHLQFVESQFCSF